MISILPQFCSFLQRRTMRCLIVICLASIVGLSTANYGGYQQLTSYLPYGNQHMYVPQQYKPVPKYQPVPVVNLDMDFSPSVAYPVHHGGAGGSMQPVFGSRSGSVSTAGSCLESEGLAKDALKANLKVLNTISKTELDTDTLKNIFGEGEFQSRSGQSCGFTDVISCGKDVTDAVMKCMDGGLSVDAIVPCAEGFLGTRKNCMGCICKILSTVSRGKLRC
jgi:hypothetical protein